jgi:hypothetical protein
MDWLGYWSRALIARTFYTKCPNHFKWLAGVKLEGLATVGTTVPNDSRLIAALV